MRIFLLSLCMCVAVSAAGPATQPQTQAAKASDRLSTTEHELKIGGQAIRYRATAGYMGLKDDTGKERANFFYIAYDRLSDGTADARRPVTFVFNGGPGAASVWLHLGTVGPKRILWADEAGNPPSPPYQLVDNEATWLASTDLVFIDPVGTGYSRPLPGEKPEQFYGVREDVSSVADFIRLYITRYERWQSPRFLAGESYGTTRAAALSDYLADRYGIALNGIMLISTVLNFQTISPSHGNDLPYALYLPAYTAIAWYHRELPDALQEDLGKAMKEAERFTLDTYTPALARGAALDAEQRKAVATQLARLTGLSEALILKSDLRIRPDQFRKLLLEDKGLVIGRFDARITGQDIQPTASHADYDPSLSRYLPAYTAAFNQFVRQSLRFESDLPYEVLSGKVHPWNFGRGNEGYLNVADDLRNAMVKHPHLKVLVASGYFDLATPYFATDYTVSHMGLPKAIAGNITQTYYLGGHMMYHNRQALVRLGEDVAKFIAASVEKR